MNNQLLLVKNSFRKELLDNILPFWMSGAPDREQGGFYGRISFDGKADKHAPRGAIMNARILWTFSAAYRHLGRKEYLEVAERAYHYLMAHFLDRKYGGVFWKLDYQSHPLETKKQIYAIAFVIYALSEYFRISMNRDALEESVNLYKIIEKYSFDPVQGGYMEAFARDWQPLEDLRLSNIDENEKKTLNTHLHLLEAYTGFYQVWPDEELKQKLSALASLFISRFISPDLDNFYLFFDEYWHLKSDRISPGHDIETAWLLLETARILDDTSLISRTEEISVKIAESVMRTGMDDTGGLVYERNKEQITNYNKEWWCQVEALVGFMNAWAVSRDEKFAEMVVQIWRFIDRFFIDRVNGEWHFRIDHQGKPYESEDKAGFWKCPYHTVRAALELMQRIK